MNMTHPGISELSKCVDSRYTLVTMTAKRARMIVEESRREKKDIAGDKQEKERMAANSCDLNKAVSQAVEEIAEGKVSYIRHEKSKEDIVNNVETISEEDF